MVTMGRLVYIPSSAGSLGGLPISTMESIIFLWMIGDQWMLGDAWSSLSVSQ